MIYTKKIILILLMFMTGFGTLQAQDEDTTAISEPTEKPLAKPAFQSGICMDLQTVDMPPAKTLEFVLQHRFGTIQDQWSTLFGIYGAANIRMGLNFTITRNLLVGFGTTKNNMLQDLQVKYTFLRQRQGGTPLTIAYYGNLALNANKNKEDYGSDYKFIDRLAWYHEFLFARRFCSYFSGQIGLSYTHFNKVDKTSDTTAMNDAFAFSVLGRFKISPQSSIVVSYQQPIIVNYDPAFMVRYPNNWLAFPDKAPYPNLSLGWEISTSTHAFHIYISAANGIVPSEIVMNNQNNFFNGYILFGFNMTRLWSF
jgi:hypothetical protein